MGRFQKYSMYKNLLKTFPLTSHLIVTLRYNKYQLIILRNRCKKLLEKRKKYIYICIFLFKSKEVEKNMCVCVCVYVCVYIYKYKSRGVLKFVNYY